MAVRATAIGANKKKATTTPTKVLTASEPPGSLEVTQMARLAVTALLHFHQQVDTQTHKAGVNSG